LAIGLFLGREGPGIRNANLSMNATRELHHRFKKMFGSTCCKVLTRRIKSSRPAHIQRCAQITGATAKMTTRLLLQIRPALIKKADWDYLRRRDSKLCANLKRIVGLVSTK
jgi:hypothetical protein